MYNKLANAIPLSQDMLKNVSRSCDSTVIFENTWDFWDRKDYKSRNKCRLFQTVVSANSSINLNSKNMCTYPNEFSSSFARALHS